MCRVTRIIFHWTEKMTWQSDIMVALKLHLDGPPMESWIKNLDPNQNTVTND